LGREDRFGARHRTLAGALAPESVDVVPGGHEWPVWRTLWERFLDARIQRHSA
jgi:enterochelin esterase-like enzyme